MKSPNILFRVALGICLGALSLSAARETFDPRVRSYIEPERLLWVSENTATARVVHAETLLKPRLGQVSEGPFLKGSGCTLVNEGGYPGILLDFGRELHGGLALAAGIEAHGMKVRVRYGESAAEAMAEFGERGTMNDHAVRDGVYELPWLGSLEIGNSGFRFARIDLVTRGRITIESVRAVSLMRPMARVGSFRSSDARLDRVWETAARTVHLCCQNFLWDGIKRDRLVWMGDMHPEICAVLAAFGAASVVPESLDYIIATTPGGQALANNMGTYSYWLVRGLHDWWFFTGDLTFLEARHGYIRATLELLARREGKDGRSAVGGLLDWPTHHNDAAERSGEHALRVLAFQDGLEMAEALDDAALAALCRGVLARARQIHPEACGENSAAALLALAGLQPARKMYDEVIGRNGIAKFSTFYGYYMLEAMSAAGAGARALDMVLDYWGAMLDVGATSFWEDFNVAWTNNAFRIDELPVKGRKDVHGDYGQFCYVGFRHSLCHGWSSGPAAWIHRHVLGVERLAPGGAKVRIRPCLGDLAWAEGDVPLMKGVLRVRHDRRPDGTVATRVVSCPEGVEIVSGP